MPRPKPLVSLHGAVNFDKLVPFDSAPDSEPLAANDILVMRKAAGGDNQIVTIGDITATGSTPISGLTGGNNNDMLFKRAGVWTGTGPFGLSYDGANMILTDDNLNFQNTGGLFSFGSGNWEHAGTGNIELSGTGNLEVNGGGDIQLSGGGALMVQDGNIELDGGQIQNAPGTPALPSYSWAGDTDTGFENIDENNRIGVSLGGSNQFNFEGSQFFTAASTGPAIVNATAGLANVNIRPSQSDNNTGLSGDDNDRMGLVGGANLIATVDGPTDSLIINGADIHAETGSGPAMVNVGASASVPVFIPNQADSDTGYTRSGVNQLSHVTGGVEALRVRATTNSLAGHTNLGLFDYDNAGLEIISVGAADSGGVGFKLLRIPN